MRKTLIAAVLTLVIGGSVEHAVAGAPHEVCRLIAKNAGTDRAQSQTSIYLLDPQGKVSKGPIDFGTYLYVDRQAFVFYVPTGYRVVTGSKSINPANSDLGGTLRLSPVAPVCPNSKTYAVDWVSRKIDLDLLPFAEKGEITESNFVDTDRNAPIDAHLVLRFDPRVVGTIQSSR